MQKEYHEITNTTARILQQVQSHFECCGWDDPENFQTDFLASCCNEYDWYDESKKICPGFQIQYINGCKYKLDWLWSYFIIAFIIPFGNIFFEFASMITIFFLIHSSKNGSFNENI